MGTRRENTGHISCAQPHKAKKLPHDRAPDPPPKQPHHNIPTTPAQTKYHPIDSDINIQKPYLWSRLTTKTHPI